MWQNEGVRQQPALQVLSIAISDRALESQYAPAARSALFRTMTGTVLMPTAPTGPPSCL